MSETLYPTALDTYDVAQVQPARLAKSAQMRLALDAVIAVETVLGLNPAGASATVAARVAAVEGAVGGLTTAVGEKVSKSGDNMTGPLEFSATPVFTGSGAVLLLGTQDSVQDDLVESIIWGYANIVGNGVSRAFVGGVGNTIASGTGQPFVLGNGNDVLNSGQVVVLGNSNRVGENSLAVVFGSEHDLSQGASYVLVSGKNVFSDSGREGFTVLTDSQTFRTQAESRTLKARFSSGLALVKGGGVDDQDGPEFRVVQSQVKTVGAAPQVSLTIPVPLGGAVLLELNWAASQTGGTSGNTGDAYVGKAYYLLTNPVGVAAYSGGANVYQANTGLSTCTVAPLASEGNIDIQVVGEADKNITFNVDAVLHVVRQ